jgi:hypothetical protein
LIVQRSKLQGSGVGNWIAIPSAPGS